MADIVHDIKVPSGHTTRAVIPIARKGTIKGCRVVQWDDDKALYDGFKCSFWSTRDAFPSMGIMPNSVEGHPDDWDRVQYGIGEPREVARGEDELKKDGQPDTKVEWEYKNRDNGGSQTNMERKIYVELADLGPEDRERQKSYRVFLTYQPKTD